MSPLCVLNIGAFLDVFFYKHLALLFDIINYLWKIIPITQQSSPTGHAKGIITPSLFERRLRRFPGIIPPPQENWA